MRFWAIAKGDGDGEDQASILDNLAEKKFPYNCCMREIAQKRLLKFNVLTLLEQFLKEVRRLPENDPHLSGSSKKKIGDLCDAIDECYCFEGGQAQCISNVRTIGYFSYDEIGD